MKTITAEQLREALDYDQESGIFTRKKDSHKGRWKAGSIAGVIGTNGYLYIGILGGRYLGHRLAWLHVTGEWPKDMIDHLDGDRANNRFANLREADYVLNVQNLRKARSRSKTGLLGVFPNKKRWMAQIRADGKHIHLGTFETPEIAHQAYLDAKRVMHAGNTL